MHVAKGCAAGTGYLNLLENEVVAVSNAPDSAGMAGLGLNTLDLDVLKLPALAGGQDDACGVAKPFVVDRMYERVLYIKIRKPA